MKVLILASYDRSLVNFRGALLRALVTAGNEAVAAAPAESPELPGQLEAWGVRFLPTPMRPAGLNPWGDMRLFFRLRRLFVREKPDLILSYTIKPVVFGTLAARSAGVPRRFALITGLGTAFFATGLTGRILSAVAGFLYRRALSECEGVFVQNKEIGDFLVDRHILADRKKIVVVPGSGVDLQHFKAVPFPIDSPPTFLLLGRLLADKGIREYVSAARLVRRQIPTATFLLVGGSDSNPMGISPAELAGWRQEGIIEYHATCLDVRPYLARCTAFVLPSYHEGLPRSVLEAMATGRPVITTDVIGCRETIFEPDKDSRASGGARQGKNGILVPVRSVPPLAQAMMHLAQNPGAAAEMGRAGRLLAEKHFDVHHVNALMLAAMGFSPAQPA